MGETLSPTIIGRSEKISTVIETPASLPGIRKPEFKAEINNSAEQTPDVRLIDNLLNDAIAATLPEDYTPEEADILNFIAQQVAH
ncbi:MAG: hypothetical protein WC503_05020 [Candidatus Shapirobacteria bacterium]